MCRQNKLLTLDCQNTIFDHKHESLFITYFCHIFDAGKSELQYIVSNPVAW